MSSHTGNSALAEEEESIRPEECRALLERILESQQLRRAPRLRGFLSFVAERALKDGLVEIHEQEIGSRLFGRSSGYDTSQDNIVRVTATEVRKRIEAYFVEDGAAETVLLEIPRGSYLPLFRRRMVAVPAPKESDERLTLSMDAGLTSPIIQPQAMVDSADLKEAAQIPKISSRLGWALSALHWTLTLSMVIATVTLLYENHVLRKSLQGWNDKPALTEFWPRFLNSAPQTDIVLADTSFALVEDIIRQPISLDDYVLHNYSHLSPSLNLSHDRREDLSMISSRNNGSFGDFNAAQRIFALDPVSGRFHLQFAREYSIDGFKRSNVILVGSRKSNPWVDLFRDHLNFDLHYDPNLIVDSVQNRSPRAGEQPIYYAQGESYGSTGYSVVAFLPNPTHTANVILLAGTNSEATAAAGEFVTSEGPLAQFQQRLHVKEFPYFEVLLKSTQLNGTATAFNAEIVAYRTYSDVHY